MTEPAPLTGVSAAARAEPGHLFGLRKTWVDPMPGIEMVQVHYAWTQPGQDPDWDAGDCRVLTPSETSPGLRSAVIEVPREVDGHREYLLHHFFFVVRGAESVTSATFTEEIVTREVAYEDDVGRWTHVGIGWGVPPGQPEPAAPNYTVAAMDGLPFEDAGAGAPRSRRRSTSSCRPSRCRTSSAGWCGGRAGSMCGLCSTWSGRAARDPRRTGRPGTTTAGSDGA